MRWTTLILLHLLIACSAFSEVLNPEETDPDKQIFYMVANTYDNSPLNRNYRLDVIINRKVSEEELETIARRLKADAGTDLDKLFITFYLPGMKLGGWAWATARFNPHLDIQVLKHSRNIEEESLSLLHNNWEELQGEWVYAYPYNRSRIVLSKKGHISYLKELYENGSISINPVHPSQVEGGTRFDYELGAQEIGYWIVAENGSLQRYDDRGAFGELVEIVQSPSIEMDPPPSYDSNPLSTVYHANGTIEETILALQTQLESDAKAVLSLMTSGYRFNIDEKRFLYDLDQAAIREVNITILYLNVEANRAYSVLGTKYQMTGKQHHGMAVLFLRKEGDDWKLANFPFANSRIPNWPQGFPNW